MAKKRADVALSKKLESIKNGLALAKCSQRAAAEQLKRLSTKCMNLKN